MTIEGEITKLNTNLTNSYTACQNKGATIPANQNFDNLASCVSSIPTTTEPTLVSLTVTPSTTTQTITPQSGTDGYNTISVSAVTSAIDSDIQAGNIKSGVNILGVTGTVTELVGETRTVSVTSTSGNTFTPSSGKNGITSIKVNPTNQNRTVIPTTTSQTLSVNSGYSGNGTISVNAVTSAIDSNIVAGNIKKDVSILGVTGTYEGSSATLITKNITQNGTYNASSDNADGYSSVVVNVPGIIPSGTKKITTNGVYDVINYAQVNINVEGSGGGSFIGLNREVVNGKYSMPTTSFVFSLPSNANDIGVKAMYYAFQNCTGLTSVDLSSLTTISGENAMNYAFYNCTGLTSVDLSSLTTVSGSNAMRQAFYNCTSLTSVDLSSLTTVSGENAMNYAFYNCTSLTSVDLSSLTTVSGRMAIYYAFQNCTGLTSVDLSSLTTVSGGQAMQYAFYSCTGLTSANFNNLQTIGVNSSSQNYGQFSSCFNRCNNLTSITFPKLKKIYCTGGTSTYYGTFANNNNVQKMYFPKLDTITYGTGASSSNQGACKNVFYGCSALTELHFGAANQSAIEASPGYSTAWGRGAGNVTIYFDL